MQKNSVLSKILLALLLSVPLFFTPFTAFGWHFGKTVIFQILIELLAFFTFFHSSFRKSGKLNFNFNWLDVSVTLFVVALVLTSLTGVNFEQSFWMNQSRAVGVFTWIHLLAMYFLLRVWLRTKEDWMSAMQWCVGVGFVVTLTAIFQNSLPDEWRGDFGGRFSGIFGNSAFFGAYMIPLIGTSVLQFFAEKRTRKWIYAVAALWFMVMIGYSASRGAFAGLLFFVGIAVCGLMWHFFRSKEIVKRKIFVIALIGIFAVLIGGGMSFAKSSPSLQRLLNFSLQQQTGKTRVMAWGIAWKSFLERPVFGWGFGNYEIPFNIYFNPQLFQYGFTETVWDKPHSAPLEMLSAMGIFAILYGAVFVVAAWMLFSKKNNQIIEDKKRNSILFATLVAYAVTVSVLFDTIAAIFLIVFLLSYFSYSVQPKWKKELSVRNFSWITKGGFVCLVGYFLFLNIQFLRSSIAVKDSLDQNILFGFSEKVRHVFSISTALDDENAILLADQLTKMEKANMLASANSLYWKDPALKVTEVLERYAIRYPNNLTYPMWAAEVYIILGEFDSPDYYAKAVIALKDAEKISPHKQEVKFLLSRVFMLQKDFENALVVSQQAVDIAPNIGQSYYFLGLTQEGSGKRSEALVSFAKALEKGYLPTENERQLYFDLLASEKQYTKLAEQYLRLIQDDQENYNWYVKLATVYALDGKKKESLEMVEKAVVLYPPLREEADNFIKQNKLR